MCLFICQTSLSKEQLKLNNESFFESFLFQHFFKLCCYLQKYYSCSSIWLWILRVFRAFPVALTQGRKKERNLKLNGGKFHKTENKFLANFSGFKAAFYGYIRSETNMKSEGTIFYKDQNLNYEC